MKMLVDKMGGLHNGSASDLHSDGQCSIHCPPTYMFLFECNNCKLKRFTNEDRLPSLWIKFMGMRARLTFCDHCNLQYGSSHLINTYMLKFYE